MDNQNTATTTVTAQDLVDEFKKNGSYDAVRQEILNSFTDSVGAVLQYVRRYHMHTN